MKTGQRIKWTSHTEKERTGTFVMYLKARPGYVLVKGDDGKSHVMKGSKPLPLKKENAR